MERLLASAGDEELDDAKLDYSIFSVVVLTLCLVLVVEILRHQLDVAASGRLFFQTVLDLMYRELTTLGMVEFFIYLMHKYHSGFNFAMEDVFVDVHFMLFYTAIFNAMQSVLVRLVTNRRTDKSWVETEDMDIGHYVAIRKEFDRVVFEVERLQQERAGSNPSTQSRKKAFGFEWIRIRLRDFSLKLLHPQLFRQKRELMVRLHFHELRAHFIEQNGLPSKFKVSQYLKRSLTRVLIDFVSISSSAWIMLMMSGNILYFVTGMLVATSESQFPVVTFLMWVYMAMMVLFLVIAFALFIKMRRIFSKILVMKLTVEDRYGARRSWRGFGATRTETNSLDQLSLFWGGYPRLIIIVTQFMQFGYALALAAIFTYFQEVQGASYGVSNASWMSALLFSYGIFLYLLGDILPWYTLCTSLGQLVDKERLHETIAKLKLDEELRKAQAAAEAVEVEKKISQRLRRLEEKEKARKRIADENKDRIVDETNLRTKGRRKSLSGGVGLMQVFYGSTTSGTTDSSRNNSSSRRRDNRRSISDGVKFMSKLHSSSEDLLEIHSRVSLSSNTVTEQLRDMNEPKLLSNDTLPIMNLGRYDFATNTFSQIGKKVLVENVGHCTTSKTEQPFVKGNQQSNGSSHEHNRLRNEMQLSQGNGMSQKSLPDDQSLTGNPTLFAVPEVNLESEHIIESIPEHVPSENSPDLPPITTSRRGRSSQMRATSDGVALMRAGSLREMGRRKDIFDDATTVSDVMSFTSSEPEFKRQRLKSKSLSEGVLFMRASHEKESRRSRMQTLHTVPDQDANLETISKLTRMPSKDLPKMTRSITSGKRKSRLRAISDGVALMRADQEDESMGLRKKVSFIGKDDSHVPGHSLVDSGENIDGDSDLDDVPRLLIDGLHNITTSKKLRLNSGDIDFALFFEGSKYMTLSLLFGPMACCFLIARVEGFNIFAGTLIDYDSTFEFPLNTCFWLETACYCCMMVELLVVLAVFSRKGKTQGILSAVWGLLVNLICFLLLMFAEIKRCCSHSDDAVSRFLASAELVTTGEDSNCCLKFGERTYGGLGSIEPYTFLIVLSPLRFIIAKTITRLFGGEDNIGDGIIKHKTQDHHDELDPDEAINIWLTTIGIHSETAKKYGLFSEQILHCMLGVPEDSSLFNNSEEVHPHDLKPIDSSERPSMTCLTVVADSPNVNNVNSFGVAFDDEFSYPTARLSRRMRRCERRLLPLLDEWILVDVALTNHELVIFDVSEVESASSNLLIDGGKGMSLMDVAKGRNVVSQFQLDDVDILGIEHSLAIPGDAALGDIENDCHQLGESWQGCTASTADLTSCDLSELWRHVNEDRLKIHFNSGCGTLYLRFLTDLKSKATSNKGPASLAAESNSLLVNVGDEIKLWCRTIARLVGATNLRMNLPHFGDVSGIDELEDFVKVVERDAARKNQNMRRLVVRQGGRRSLFANNVCS